MRTLFFVSLVSLGCGPTVVSPPPSTDSGVASADLPATDRGPAAGDTPVAVDAPVATDVPPFPLVGRWRLTRLEVTDDMGMRREFSDTDRAFPDGMGGSVQGRTNGTLHVANDRIALGAGVLVNGHFFTNPMGYSAFGFAASGLLDAPSGRFTFPGMGAGTTLRRTADGTIELVGDVAGTSRMFFTRSTGVPNVPRLSLVGLAVIREMPPSPMPDGLRVGLFWDRASSMDFTESNGTAVRFVGRFATYPVVLADAPPSEVRGSVGVANVALARVVLYLDGNANLRYDTPSDRFVAVSPVAIAWRDTTAAVDATNTPVRDLSPGYQFVHVHQDVGAGRPTVTPFDNSNLVAPDLPVSQSMSAIPRPEDVL